MVTAPPRGGVGSNRGRTGGPQETNTIRRGTTTSLLGYGEVWNTPVTLWLACKAMAGSSAWLVVERWEVCVGEARRPVDRGVVGRSQSPGSTESVTWW